MRGTRLWRVRRAVFLVRRSPPRLARPASLAVRAATPRRPILLIGCPRSGTTVLRGALLASGEARSVQAEGHILWNEFHPPRRRVATSDALTAADVTERERRFVHLAVRAHTRGRRFLDKTPESCLRISYLDALFPGAQYVFLHRRAADNVNSLIEGWRARPRFVTHRLPEPLAGIAPLDGERWSFALVPGWRELRDAPLEEVCARQYVACNEAALDGLAALPAERWTAVGYEAL
ncbi:MAG TPA: sulfotransferase, partial [Solirubrobacteraceae bacterium]|nr:sulfotransferase [Solirubrobacteraceae bacterium]